MEGKINFNRNLVLGKEEVDRWQSFTYSDISNATNMAHLFRDELIVLNKDVDAFKPTFVNPATITIAAGTMLNKTDSKILFTSVNNSFTTVLTPNVGGSEYICLRRAIVNTESGVLASVSGNQLTITSGSIDDYVRDQSGLDNTKIKFPNSVSNTGVYDIVNRIDSANYIVSGDLTNESSLTIAIVGTYDLEKVSPTAELYDFGSLSISQEVDLATAETNGIPICKITWIDSSTFTIDKDYRYRYGFLGGRKLMDLAQVSASGTIGSLTVPALNPDVIYRFNYVNAGVRIESILLSDVPISDYYKYRGSVFTFKFTKTASSSDLLTPANINAGSIKYIEGALDPVAIDDGTLFSAMLDVDDTWLIFDIIGSTSTPTQ